MYGARTLRILVEEDYKAYLEQSMLFRTNLFKQFMRVLDLSLAVQMTFKEQQSQQKNKNMTIMITNPVGATPKKVGLAAANLRQPAKAVVKPGGQKEFRFEDESDMFEAGRPSTDMFNFYRNQIMETPKGRAEVRVGLQSSTQNQQEASVFQKKKRENVVNYRLRLVF
mmetsp:Transcript_19741/g.14467  ORF Transcript_19741/g.14467 Transcript_19741/m.14467 type:complete len:168 (-) Transcript_19741:808-1311(-)